MKDMTYEKISSSSVPLSVDKDRCIGCNRCVDACQIDIFLPSDENDPFPKIIWPGECWYCGACIMECPVNGALVFRHPLMNQARFIEKDKLETR